MSYAIPTNELTLSDIKQFKVNAQDAGIARAIALGIARDRSELVIREANPDPDFAMPILSGYTDNHYVTGAAIAANAWYPVFDLVVAPPALVPVLARTQVAVFYKIADAAVAPTCTAVRFRVGVTGNSTKASFHTQLAFDNKLEPEVWLSEPVVYDPEDVLYIEFYPRAICNNEELSFGCFILERVGATVS